MVMNMSTLNKIANYIQTYGLIKGLNIIAKRNRAHSKSIKEIEKLLPICEQINKPILEKYLEQQAQYIPSNNLFFFWYDGIESAPKIVQMCYTQLKKLYEKDYNILLIDKHNIKSLINLPASIYCKLETSDLTIQMFSDLVRAACISQIGGIWIDSTLYIPKKIDFTKYLTDFQFFTLVTQNTKAFFSYKGTPCSWSSFLLGANKGSILFNCFLEMMIKSIEELHEKPYFLVDITLMLCATNKIDNNLILNFAEHNTSPEDIYYLTNHLNCKMSEKHLEKVEAIPQKLNWRIDIEKLKSTSLINYLYSKVMA